MEHSIKKVKKKSTRGTKKEARGIEWAILSSKNVRQEQRKGGKLEADMLGTTKKTKLEGKNADPVSGSVQPEDRIPAKFSSG